MVSGSEALGWKKWFQSISYGLNKLLRHTSKHCWLHFPSKNKIKYPKALYLCRVERTCIFGTALIVPIRNIRPKAHVVTTLYIFVSISRVTKL